MKTLFCPHCEVEREVTIREGEEIFNVRGEPISVLSKVAICGHCGKELVDEELESENFERAYRDYRKNHDLLSPREIRGIRERYGLSQRALAKLLRWGEVTINRYENGAIQDKVHDDMLRFIGNPRNMWDVYERNADALPPRRAKRLQERIEAALQGEVEAEFEQSLQRVLGEREPDEMNGFRRFNLDKMENLILFFASSVNHAFKTKMTKLLWYADFLCFNDTSRSITGSPYLAYKLGPVPDNYDLIFGDMQRRGVLDVQEEVFETSQIGEGFCGERIVARQEYDPEAFSPDELRCAERVAEEFKDLSATATVKRAHQEEAYKRVYKEGARSEQIPYTLAETLSISLD